MKNQILLIILCLGSCFLYLDSYSQITRGASPAELYLSTDWYIDNYGDIHYGIFRSADNGATITLQYENSTASPPGNMSVGKVLGDATPGALYNYGNNELWVTFDYGESWEYKEDYPDNTYYMSGLFTGIIYKTSWVKLHKSENYGQNFTVITDPLTIPIPEIGFIDGEFFGINGSAGIGFNLVHTNDYANTYTEISIDSIVAFWSPSGHWPQISRGTLSGELYFVSWWLEPNNKIFHSVDTGYTWTEKYESEYIDLYFWRVNYTAGREPGSFYVMRSRINPAGDHVWLYIDYSSDHGETFTTYFHDLDSTLTSIKTPELKKIELTNYPNPFKTNTTFKFQLPENCNNPVLNIFDVHGTRIINFNITGKSSQVWDGRKKNGCKVPCGVYLYNISCDNCSSQLKKLILTN